MFIGASCALECRNVKISCRNRGHSILGATWHLFIKPNTQIAWENLLTCAEIFSVCLTTRFPVVGIPPKSRLLDTQHTHCCGFLATFQLLSVACWHSGSTAPSRALGQGPFSTSVGPWARDAWRALWASGRCMQSRQRRHTWRLHLHSGHYMWNENKQWRCVL